MTERFTSHAQARLALVRRAMAEQPDNPALRLQLADALADAGEHDAFARAFRDAYLKQSTTGLLLGALPAAPSRDDVLRLHDRATALIARGIAYSPVIAALAVSEALLGNRDAARRLVDYDRFLHRETLAVPDGYTDMDFRAALEREIATKLDYAERGAANSGNAWFHNGLTQSDLPASKAFTAAARRAAQDYIAALPHDDDHPFARSRPDGFALIGWGVVARRDSSFEAHIHPQAWASGVYYVKEPAAARDGHRGWLRLGAPARLALGEAWPELLIPPRAGQLVLMPGYFFHETRALGVDEERISIAFDVVPKELATSNAARHAPDTT